MYKISISDLNDFNALLDANDVEYLDVFFRENSILFVSNTNEIFAMLRVPAEKSYNENAYDCRIPRKLLKNALSEGILEIESSETDVTLHISSGYGRRFCTVKFLNQKVYNFNYLHKIDVLETFSPDYYINVDGLSELSKISRAANSARIR